MAKKCDVYLFLSRNKIMRREEEEKKIAK